MQRHINPQRRTVTCYLPRSDPQCHGSKIEEADQGRGDEEKAVRCEHVTEAHQCKFIERWSFEGGDCDWDRGCDRDRGRGWKGIRLPEGDSGGRRRHKTEVRTNSFAHVRASPNPVLALANPAEGGEGSDQGYWG